MQTREKKTINEENGYATGEKNGLREIMRWDLGNNSWKVVRVGRLVVVIDVNPSHGFWTARLMKVFEHEGKCTYIYNTHVWIVYIMLFLVVCGTSRGSS